MTIFYTILHAIVRNKAMREDPPEVYGWRVFALACSACFGGMLYGWDIGSIGGILSMSGAEKVFGYEDLSDTQKSTLSENIVSTLQLGALVSSLVVSWFADRFGRQPSLIVTGIVTVVGVIFQAASAANGTLPLMYIGRFVSGIGVGSASTLTPLYVAECAPRAIRGALTCTWVYIGRLIRSRTN
jgi:MFS family permease